MKINYRRFARRRLLAMQADGFHANKVPVSVKTFHATPTKGGTIKPSRRVKPRPFRAAGGMTAPFIAANVPVVYAEPSLGR